MKCQKNNSFNCPVTENSKKTNTSVALNWEYNPYKVEEDIFSKPLSKKEKEYIKKYSLVNYF